VFHKSRFAFQGCTPYLKCSVNRLGSAAASKASLASTAEVE
jgi:hypothetical protein